MSARRIARRTLVLLVVTNRLCAQIVWPRLCGAGALAPGGLALEQYGWKLRRSEALRIKKKSQGQDQETTRARAPAHTVLEPAVGGGHSLESRLGWHQRRSGPDDSGCNLIPAEVILMVGGNLRHGGVRLGVVVICI